MQMQIHFLTVGGTFRKAEIPWLFWDTMHYETVHGFIYSLTVNHFFSPGKKMKISGDFFYISRPVKIVQKEIFTTNIVFFKYICSEIPARNYEYNL